MALDETQRAGRPDISLEAAIALGAFWEARAHVGETERLFERLLAVEQPASLRSLGLRDPGCRRDAPGQLPESQAHRQ